MSFYEYRDEYVIEKNEKWFNFYINFPLIMAIVIAVSFFIWGIVDPSTIQITTYRVVNTELIEDKLYGVMSMNTAFGAMIVWWIIGAVVAIINYFAYKIIFTPTILQIMYLKNINLNSDLMAKRSVAGQSKAFQQASASQAKVSYSAWTCPKCGEKNNYAAKNCINCFEPKP